VRIAFFGLPIAALLLDRDGHDLAWCGIARRHAVGARRLVRRLGADRVSLGPNADDSEVLRQLRAARPELIVSWFWTKKIPSPILGLAPSFGVHPSLLPRHRGPDPYFWAIDSGDERTGVTAHALGAEYDTGAILAQRLLRIDPCWNAWQLARALDRPSLALLRDVTRAFAEGRAPPPHPQDDRLATAAPQPSDDELSIRWSWSAGRIERRVRAAAPWPGAWTQIGDHIVTLERVRPTSDFPRALAPGEAAVRPDGVAVVRAGDAALELVSGRDDDDGVLRARDLAEVVRSAQRFPLHDKAGYDSIGSNDVGSRLPP
jgi:methionyl-tRNA formyltransferase